MKLYLRHAALGAAVLAIGTTAAQAQTVIERQVVDPPLVISPPQTVITREVVPAGTVITTPAPVTETVVTQPRTIERTIVTEQPAPSRRVVTTHKTTTHANRTAVRLSTDQRRTVYRTIVHERAPAPVVRERVVTTGAAIAEPTAVTYRVGTVLPPSVPIYAMPQDVALGVPDVGPYDYALVNNRVLLVDPDTNTVVGEAYE